MNLTDLNPRWVLGSKWKTPDGTFHFIIRGNDDHGRHGMGLSFLCPVHKTHRLVVFFANPIDGQPPEEDTPLWVRKGETFETMTLDPSINARDGFPNHPNKQWPGCWHGHITQGAITTV